MKLIETIKRILEEETQIPSFLKRRLNYRSEDEILSALKRNSLRNLRLYTMDRDKFQKRVFESTAYEMVDWTDDMSEEKLDGTIPILAEYLKNNYQNEIDEYFDNLYTGDIHSTHSKYVFYKHLETYGGRGFKKGFDSWYKLLESYGYWFPIDWWEVKKELDKVESGSTLIMRPGDKLNNFGYYFTIIKKSRE